MIFDFWQSNSYSKTVLQPVIRLLIVYYIMYNKHKIVIYFILIITNIKLSGSWTVRSAQTHGEGAQRRSKSRSVFRQYMFWRKIDWWAVWGPPCSFIQYLTCPVSTSVDYAGNAGSWGLKVRGGGVCGGGGVSEQTVKTYLDCDCMHVHRWIFIISVKHILYILPFYVSVFIQVPSDRANRQERRMGLQGSA